MTIWTACSIIEHHNTHCMKLLDVWGYSIMPSRAGLKAALQKAAGQTLTDAPSLLRVSLELNGLVRFH